MGRCSETPSIRSPTRADVGLRCVVDLIFHARRFSVIIPDMMERKLASARLRTSARPSQSTLAVGALRRCCPDLFRDLVFQHSSGAAEAQSET